ncbi:MAG: hypothetical protein AAGK33_07545 [Pseudomonadota bacterium]
MSKEKPPKTKMQGPPIPRKPVTPAQAPSPAEDLPVQGVEAVRQALRRSALARKEAEKREQEAAQARTAAEVQKRQETVILETERLAALVREKEKAAKAELEAKADPKSAITIATEKALKAAKEASALAEPSPVVKTRLPEQGPVAPLPVAKSDTKKAQTTAGEKDQAQTKPAGKSEARPASQKPTGNQPAAVPEDQLLTERPQHSIVPRSSVAGTALTTVIAIMAFLASLTLGSVSMVRDTAAGWQSDIAREVTIQIRPVEGTDMAQAMARAQAIAQGFDGVTDVSVLDDSAMNRLLEPWLGAGLDLDTLPVPRLIMVRVDEASPPDFAALRQVLAADVPGASLDNHRAWVDRLTTMAQATVAVGLVVFLLMLGATMLMVVFATRGAMSGNAHVIEVLHFVGAEQSYIAGEFQRHFLLLGLKGAVTGGLTAIGFFLILGWWTARNVADPAAEQVSALFGTFSVGLWGYVGVLVLIFVIALLTALTSRLTVYRHVGVLDRSGADT